MPFSDISNTKVHIFNKRLSVVRKKDIDDENGDLGSTLTVDQMDNSTAQNRTYRHTLLNSRWSTLANKEG